MKESTNNHFCNPFISYIEESFALDATTKALIAQQSHLMTIKKGELILNAGNVCNYVYFIISGEAISYFNNSRGKTTTFFFYFNSSVSTIKNLFAVDYKSFLSSSPASISIVSVSAVKAIRFSKENIDYLIEKSPIFERWIRTVDEKVYSYTFDRVFSLLTLSAKDRYEKFLKEEPYLLNIFSNYHIASYLGITAQSLSRIRSGVKNLKSNESGL
ncbi:Crp/Fnr family transcriptional regulator [Mucilaginibacter sp.]|uniref:Crp/Fnr family transcriptional regulator n=1 Tax=Mucilaginibacter sp. TaxID=1882438 RepID=UPI0035BBCDC1